MTGKKVVVTGGWGFVGSHLVDELIKTGNEVVVIDNGSQGDTQNSMAGNIEGDFALMTVEQLASIFDGMDYVFHVGAWSRMPQCMSDPVGAYANNVTGSVKVLEAARRAGVKRVVLSSSCIVYCEETPYKSTKIAMEDIARVYRTTFGLSTICLRYGNIYGTRQKVGQDSAMFAMLKDASNKNGKVQIFGDGTQTRDWISVKDIVRANILVAEQDTEGEFDICTGRSIDLNYIIDVLGLEAEHVEERKGDAKHINLDPKPAKDILGFEAEIKFEEEIKDVWKNL